MSRPSIIERAFQIAREGRCATTLDVEKQLRAEGLFELGALDGAALRRQLRDTCRHASGKTVRVPVGRKPATARRPTRPSLF